MIRIGIVCPSEIAFRRFMPSIIQNEDFEYMGVACAKREEWFGDISPEEFEPIHESEISKAQRFVDSYGGKIFTGYEDMLSSGEIDAVYLPLPPALHYRWAKKALETGLHVFVEKPSTISSADTKDLIESARTRGLALHENYMFAYHSQLEKIKDAVNIGTIGDVRVYRIDFGFPFRGINDFRYSEVLGGGALLDCGGYVLKYADMLLGGEASIVAASKEFKDGVEVDIFGTAMLTNPKGETVQLAFGMDNDYRCSVDVWGSKGTLTSKRVFTAPAGLETTYEIVINGESKTYSMGSDDAFLKSIERFKECVMDASAREDEYGIIERQMRLVEQFREKAGLQRN